ncbi:MAG: hypothetical protein RQ824_07545 [bacterium]|nr:hypothetical protein [bacterium]
MKHVYKNPPEKGWWGKAHEIIFEADTPAGKSFDLLIMTNIILSVFAVMMKNVTSVRNAIIAVPTSIVTAEISQQTLRQKISTRACPECSLEGHDSNAIHCKWCGARL